MRISDWSSDVCSSDLFGRVAEDGAPRQRVDFEKMGMTGAARQRLETERARAGKGIEHGAAIEPCLALAVQQARRIDRKSVVEGKRVSVRVALGGRSFIKKKKIIKRR